MPRVSPIQESFAYGELDKRIQARVNTDAYRGGLKRALNWYPLVQGPIRMRQGSLFQTQCDGRNWISGNAATSGFRVITFQQGLDADVVFEIGEDENSATRFLIGRGANGDPIVDGETGNLIIDPQYTLAIPGVAWTFDNAAYDFGVPPVVSSLAGPFAAGTPDALVTIQSDLDFTTQTFNGGALESASGSGAIILPAGSELLLNTVTIDYQMGGNVTAAVALTPLPASALKLRFKVGTTPGGSDVEDQTLNIASIFVREQLVISFTPGATNNTLYLSLGWEWTGGAIPDFEPGNITLGLYPTTWVAPLAGGTGLDVEFVSPWSAAQLECLQWCQDPAEQYGVFTHPEVEQHVLKYVAPDWIFQPLSSEAGFVAPTGTIWSSENYPGACAFHEGRLWFGGSPQAPAALWASRSGDFVDFDAAAPTTKADPLLFLLSNSGTIQTLTSRKELVINADISEVVGTSQQGVIASDDFSFPKQTDWGSNCVQPIVVGRNMVYTSNSRKRVRTFADEGGTNFGWDGNELSLLANDIFSSAVRRMVYLDEPGYQACFLLADGTMGMCTYYYPEDTIGWWRYETAYNGQTPDDPGDLNQGPNAAQPSNNIVDITKVNTSQGAKLWMVVNRVGYAGSQNLQHELLSFDPDSGIRAALDNYATRTAYDVFANGEIRVDDIDELTDQSISVIVEGVDSAGNATWTVHPNVTAVVGNSSPLESWVQAGDTVHVGLAYENEIQLLSLEGVSNRGTSQSSKRRWNKVYARMNDSPVPLIEGVYAKDRTPSSPMGQGEPFTSNDTEIVDLGSGEGDLLITQDRKLTTEIVGIFGKVGSSEI